MANDDDEQHDQIVDTVQQRQIQFNALTYLVRFILSSYLIVAGELFLNDCFRRGGRGRAQSFDEAAFISQLTLLDVQVK